MPRVFFLTFLTGLACNHALRAPEPTVQLIDNSVGFTQVIDLNESGNVLGTREVTVEPSGLAAESYYWQNNRQLKIKLLAGYTNIEPQALSDTGLVVGYATRFVGNPAGNMQAFLWDVTTDEPLGLETLVGYRTSHACAVNKNGTVISGYVVGSDPPRMVPCVWKRIDGNWKNIVLPTTDQYNPSLHSSRVLVSPDGNQIAACITSNSPTGQLTSSHRSLCVWRVQADGSWEPSEVYQATLRLSAINDLGMIVGSRTVKTVRQAFVWDPAHGFQMLGLLEGDESAEALGVNNKGLVVGYSDDPHGPSGGPQAFIWKDGKLLALEFPLPTLYSSATTVTDSGMIGGFLQTSPDNESEASKTLSFVFSMPKHLR